MGPGRTIGGRYRIAERIGRGGHGEVYRAQQLPLGRDVALKVLLPEAYAGEGPERFAREALLVQTLDHPNTVRLYDFGVDEGGFPFMAFELLRGRTLEEEIEKGALAPDRVARIATQVLKALMDAHARGIIHRDIKPSNVFLVDFAGEKDFVKVLDFGVARRTVESSAQPRITSDGEIVGTPAYMAPEQVKGAPIGPSTDLYSLGLVIAEALSGKMVVYGRSEPEIWIKQASDKPVEIPDRVLTSAFGPVVLRATNKDPAQRYASAEEMLRAIDHAMTLGAAATDDLEPPATLAPATVPMAQPPSPRASPPDTTALPPALPVVTTPMPRATPPAKIIWTRGAIAAVVVTLTAMAIVVTLTLRATSAKAPIRTAPIAIARGPIEVPPMPPVAEKVTPFGWTLKHDSAPDTENDTVVGKVFVFEKTDPDVHTLYIYVWDYRQEEGAVIAQANYGATRPDWVVRRKGARLLVIDDGKKGRGDGPAIADQLVR